ncbi:YdcF- like protein [Thioalkalivibrio nitratireducens DSM 14787]|uniref:YdcF-like protein n=1 Tax=Thioalkalivibrio nitratireducens (strain DSM 14787 / UNIQEM 213 / ALEN2) TaxID=1255043 RepID=L0DS51_THIND|nr:ElyC/SanA/YdcF family protein [Thioalkalivibrio nitratireducens]AGA32404.1 YdcF- like protein [Thioalkalivibrio nitratireducens DSM 14787]
MLDTLKPLVGALAAPLALATLLVLLAALLWSLGRRGLGRLLLVLGLLLVFLSSWAPVANRLLAPLEGAYPPVSDPRDHGDATAVVVLGAGWDPELEAPASVRLNDSAVHRLVEGLRLLEALPEARLLVSGASRDATRLPVALGYAQAAQALGVDPARIVVLDTPVDTAQEAYAVRAVLANGERFFLVTSASHMRRAVRHFERAGLAPIASPSHYLTGRDGPDRLRYWLPSAGNLRKTERAVYEMLGLWALEWDHRDR